MSRNTTKTRGQPHRNNNHNNSANADATNRPQGNTNFAAGIKPRLSRDWGACRDPISTQDTTAMTSIQDALEQLRELYHAAKKRTKKREGEASYSRTLEDNGQLDPSHFI